MAAKIDLDEAAIAAIEDFYGERPKADHWFYRGQEPNIPALAVAYIARKDADSYTSCSMDFAMGDPPPNPFTGKREFCTPRVIAGEELAARYVDELFESWGISRTFEPSVKTWEFHDGSAAEARKKPFGARDGSWERESGLYYDNAMHELWWNTDDSGAIAQIDILIEEGLKVCADARAEFKNGKLDPDSWALSCGGMALTLRAHLEVGSTWGAMYCASELSRLLTMHGLSEHELAIEKRKEDSGTGGANSRALTDAEEKAAAQKFRELYATSQISKTGAQERIGKEFNVSRQTIGRIVAKHPPEK